MKLYVTDNGSWGGTRAEMPKLCREDGSPAGGWKEVNVPTDKPNLIAYLNHRKQPTTPQVRERTRVPPPTEGSGRWRTYFKGMFAGVVLADDEDKALEQAKTLLEVKPSG